MSDISLLISPGGVGRGLLCLEHKTMNSTDGEQKDRREGSVGSMKNGNKRSGNTTQNFLLQSWG